MAAVRSVPRFDPQPLVQIFSQRLPASGALVVALILLALAVIGAGAAASASTVLAVDGPVSPFDVYTAIMPGQPITALEAFDCGSPYSGTTEQSAFYCMIRPDDGPIRSISVSGSKGKIESLTMRASDVRVGDLIAHWGHPNLTRVYKRSFSMAWDGGIYVIGSLRGRFSYWSNASYVLVMNPPN
jgi:hypothetical protein